MKPKLLIHRWRAKVADTPGDKSVTDAEAKGKRWDRRFQRAAHISAVLALLLAAGGYYFTVLPVFESKRLKEQNEQLLEENEKVKQQMTGLREERDRITSEIRSLNDNLTREKARSEQLASAATNAKAREIEARRLALEAEVAEKGEQLKLSTIEATMSREMTKLDKARWELVIHDFFFATLLPRWNRRVHSPFDDDKAGLGAYLTAADKEWPDPYHVMMTAVDEIEAGKSAREMPASYYVALREFVKAHESALQCPKPDFSQMRAQYLKAMEAVGPQAEADTVREIQKVRADYAAKNETVLITDEYRASILRSAKYGRAYDIRSKEQDRVMALEKVCDEKLNAAFDELRKAKVGSP